MSLLKLIYLTVLKEGDITRQGDERSSEKQCPEDDGNKHQFKNITHP